jgi:hypothetical protein
MNDNAQNSLEIEKLFSKHQQPACKQKVNFNSQKIKDNKKELGNFEELNIIKKSKHFFLEDGEICQNYSDEEEIKNSFEKNGTNEKQKDEGKNHKSYFKNVLDDTLKNDSIYCSYLDHFDKIWIKNSKIIFYLLEQLKNNNSLSCAYCFNQISYESISVKHFTNVQKSKEMINTFVDYMETYNNKEIINLIEQSNTNGSNSKIGLTVIQISELGIDSEDNKQYKPHISVKCTKCNICLGFLNSENDEFIIFNSI